MTCRILHEKNGSLGKKEEISESIRYQGTNCYKARKARQPDNGNDYTATHSPPQESRNKRKQQACLSPLAHDYFYTRYSLTPPSSVSSCFQLFLKCFLLASYDLRAYAKKFCKCLPPASPSYLFVLFARLFVVNLFIRPLSLCCSCSSRKCFQCHRANPIFTTPSPSCYVTFLIYLFWVHDLYGESTASSLCSWYTTQNAARLISTLERSCMD